MTGSPQHEIAAVFGPSEIAKLTQAFDAALSAVTEGGQLYAGMSSRDVRREIASRIIKAAEAGVLDPDVLAEAALRSMAAANERGAGQA